MRVDGHPWLYAIGDVNGSALFTHMGKYQARIAADDLLGRDTAISHGADGPLSPRVIFTEPQVAAVGHTTDTAAAGRARGRGGGDRDVGQRRRVVLRARRARDGAAADRPRAPRASSAPRSPAPRSASMLHAATVAIVGEVPLERLRHAVPCFPTRSEIWLSLLA